MMMRMSDVGLVRRHKASTVSGDGTWMTEWVNCWGKVGLLFIGTGISRVLLAVTALGFFCVAAASTAPTGRTNDRNLQRSPTHRKPLARTEPCTNDGAGAHALKNKNPACQTKAE